MLSPNTISYKCFLRVFGKNIQKKNEILLMFPQRYFRVEYLVNVKAIRCLQRYPSTAEFPKLYDFCAFPTR